MATPAARPTATPALAPAPAPSNEDTAGADAAAEVSFGEEAAGAEVCSTCEEVAEVGAPVVAVVSWVVSAGAEVEVVSGLEEVVSCCVVACSLMADSMAAEAWALMIQ